MSMKNGKEEEKNPRIVYADIIDLPHHEPVTRPRMTLQNRAAQFSAFDALAGFSDMIAEKTRAINALEEEAGEGEPR